MKKPQFDFVDKANMSLLTDFYELTMCASYFENGRNETATFDLFIRKLPPNRSYFVFAGLEQVLLFLENMKFSEEHINYLKGKKLNEPFLEYLKGFKFTGEVWSVPEGTLVFPEEPLIRVTAPIIEAQLVETFILNTVNLQTMIATKASRVVHAAKGRPVIEFGLRRTQGTDAGMKAARCSYLAGAEGTSNVLAGMKYGIPLFGTMAHSYIMFFDKELDSFRAFAKTFPESSTFLIDTYDDLKGAENAAIVAEELEKKGYKLNAVRLDSGNLLSISQKVRRILDDRGLDYVKIFASGDLDEYAIEQLLKKGAKIDAFGVGTRMGTSLDRPYVDVVYKLSGKVEDGDFVPTMKLSKGKATLPGKKQIFRKRDRNGSYAKDVIGLENERIEGECLLKEVMKDGQVTCEMPTLELIRKTTLKNLSELPEKYKRLRNPSRYSVELSSRLASRRNQVSERLKT
ncbi:MAG: nicotinate phosphoribosyltransferase [Candidatus Bathyarchaeia archaeon]|jgi:nicotinate phosphoribosyltransferase